MTDEEMKYLITKKALRVVEDEFTYTDWHELDSVTEKRLDDFYHLLAQAKISVTWQHD